MQDLCLSRQRRKHPGLFTTWVRSGAPDRWPQAEPTAPLWLAKPTRGFSNGEFS